MIGLAQEERPLMRPLRGIALKLGSVLIFIVMASMIKATAAHVPAGQAVFFRSFFAIPVIVVWLIWRRELRTGLKTANPFGHLWRGLMGTLAMGFGFAGLGYLPLPEVTAIGYAAPILTVIFAAMFLGEEVRLFRISAVALGMIGVLIVVYPRLTRAVGGRGRLCRGVRGAGGAGGGAVCLAGAGLRAQAGAGGKDRHHRVLVFRHRGDACRWSPCPSAGSGPPRSRPRCWSARGCWAGSGRSC